MVIIYPPDPTTEFLSAIINEISKLPIEIKNHDFHYISKDDSINQVKDLDSIRSIIYLGHGTQDELNVNNGEETIISLFDARRMFKNKKIVLLSCYSSSFIKGLNNDYEVGLGFGNIPTSKSELKGNDIEKYNHEDYKCIDIFKLTLVSIFKNSILEAINLNYSFQQLYYALKLRINKKISQCSLSSDKTDRLVGELFYDIKKEIVLFGNHKANFS